MFCPSLTNFLFQSQFGVVVIFNKLLTWGSQHVVQEFSIRIIHFLISCDFVFIEDTHDHPGSVHLPNVWSRIGLLSQSFLLFPDPICLREIHIWNECVSKYKPLLGWCLILDTDGFNDPLWGELDLSSVSGMVSSIYFYRTAVPSLSTLVTDWLTPV